MCRYVTMQLTQWFQPQEATIISFTKSWSTVILKVIMIDDLDVDDEDVLDHHDYAKVGNFFYHHIIQKSQSSSS